MFKDSKYVKLICIVLVFSALALALSMGILAISALRNETFADPLDGYQENLEKETVTLPPPIPPDGPDPDDDPDGDNTSPYQVYSDQAVDALYLRGEAFGNYNGKGWDQAVPYTNLIEDKYPATYLGSLMIEEWSRAWGMSPIALSIKPNDAEMIIPSYTATSEYVADLMGTTDYKEEYLIPEDDVTANPKSSEIYRMHYYNYTNVSKKKETPTTYALYERVYRDFVYDHYLYVDDTTKSYMLDIIDKQKFDFYDQNVAQNISDYVSGLGEYLITYDQALDQEENMVIAFIEKYKAGTCKHFASTATLIFRSMGIPARYVTGYMTATEAGEWVQLDNFNSHAWVEIYVDGFGWKTVEVTPAQQKDPIEIKPVDVKKKFDGTPIFPEYKIEGFEEYEKLGYTYEVVISGERTEPGISESIIEDIKIFDSNKTEVTDNFLFDKKPGKIIVFVSGVVLRSESISQVYDGIPRTSDLSKCSIDFEDGAKLLEGHTIRMEARLLETKIGVHSHAFDVIVEDSEGNNVTDVYLFSYDLGKYEISPISITIKAGSAEQEYIPGKILTCDQYEITSGKLMEGDYIPDNIVITKGEQKVPGRSPNTIDRSKIVILNSEGEDVSSNYVIRTEVGELRLYESE